jgi:hypothetical protein
MTNPTPDDREIRRSKLIGRLMIVGLGLLLLVYCAAMFLPQRGH